ncbi:MAG: glycosyltransferase [Ruminiclostridium sp.]|nr:glycosyltransferase [Ruminiclostridium sp.]
MKETAPAVSVIVPVYNVEKYIGRCLNSLINQTCSCNYEIVVVNDGTQDNSMDIVNRYAKNYDFIKIVNQENKGISGARNTGILNSSGEYIAFVDSDDYVSKNYIKLLYDSATENNSDVVCCNYRNVTGQNGKGIDNFLVHTKGVYDGRKIMREALHDITVRSYLWNKLYRRSLFTDHNITFPEGISFEDFAVMPQLFYHSERVSFIPETLYFYVHRSTSMMGNISKKDIKNYIEAYAILRKFLEDNDIFKDYKLTYSILGKKISATIFGMLVRCWWKEPATARVIKNYSRTCKYLKLYSGEEYYVAPMSELEIKII